MTWYLVFFLGSLPSILLSILDFRRERKNAKKKLPFYLAIAVIIGGTINAIYSPLDYYEGGEKMKQIDQTNKKLEYSVKLQSQNIQKLFKENSLLIQKNQLLEKNQFLTDTSLKNYKSNISRFSVSFDAVFKINSKTNISSGSASYIVTTNASLINEKYPARYIPFVSHPVYDYKATSDDSVGHRSITYNFSGIAEVINGSFPLAQNIEILKDYYVVSIYVPMFNRIALDDLGSNNFEVVSCNLSFTLNGVDLKKHSLKCPKKPIAEIAKFLRPEYQKDYLTIQFKTEKSIYETFNLKAF